MNNLIVKSVFAPTDNYLSVCIKSIINLFDYLYLSNNDKNDKYQVSILIIGWCNKELYIECIEKIINNYNQIYDIKLIIYRINYGKLKILNECFSYIKNNNYSNMFYFDHDILFSLHNQSDIFKHISKLNDVIINDKKVGLFAFNQTNDCRHQMTIYQNSAIIDTDIDKLKIDVVYPDKKLIGSIASGAFYILNSAITELSEISSSLPLTDVYTLDDHVLMNKLESIGYTSVVLKNYFVIHPYDICDKDLKYKEWKYHKIINYINNINKNTNTNMITDDNSKYYKSIEESINFWSKY